MLATTLRLVTRNVVTEFIATQMERIVMIKMQSTEMDAAQTAKLRLVIFVTAPHPVLQPKILVINPVEMQSIITKSLMNNVMMGILQMAMDVIQLARLKRTFGAKILQTKNLCVKKTAVLNMLLTQMKSVMMETK